MLPVIVETKPIWQKFSKRVIIRDRMGILTNYNIAWHVMRLKLLNESVEKRARFKDQSCIDPEVFIGLGVRGQKFSKRVLIQDQMGILTNYNIVWHVMKLKHFKSIRRETSKIWGSKLHISRSFFVRLGVWGITLFGGGGGSRPFSVTLICKFPAHSRCAQAVWHTNKPVNNVWR